MNDLRTAAQESLRERMAEIQRLRAALAQPATIAEWWATKQAASGVPLTDEQIDMITAEQWGRGLGAPYAAYRAYARAVEAAHGITAKEA